MHGVCCWHLVGGGRLGRRGGVGREERGLQEEPVDEEEDDVEGLVVVVVVLEGCWIRHWSQMQGGWGAPEEVEEVLLVVDVSPLIGA